MLGSSQCCQLLPCIPCSSNFSFPSRCSGHAGRSQRAHILLMSSSLLRGNDRLRQSRVSHRVVPFWLCRTDDQTQGQMVLSQMCPGKKEEMKQSRGKNVAFRLLIGRWTCWIRSSWNLASSYRQKKNSRAVITCIGRNLHGFALSVVVDDIRIGSPSVYTRDLINDIP